MKALLEKKREIAKHRKYLAENEGVWNFAVPNKDDFQMFNDILKAGRTANGLKYWKEGGFSMKAALEGENRQDYYAAIHYMIRHGYMPFEHFEDAVEAAHAYAEASIAVKKYDKAQANGATA